LAGHALGKIPTRANHQGANKHATCIRFYDKSLVALCHPSKYDDCGSEDVPHTGKQQRAGQLFPSWLPAPTV